MSQHVPLPRRTFDRQSIKGPLLTADAQELVFEARLNQNLEFKATFPMDKIMPTVSAEKVETAEPTNGN